MSDIVPLPKRRAMEPLDNDADSTSPEPDTKRRKLRKGTKSCWDCKKRKVKCTFDATSDTVCISCHRRGVPCIGQDQPEEEFQANAETNRDPLLHRMTRVEALLEQIIELGHNVERDVARAGLGLPARSKSGYFTPVSDTQSPDSFKPPPASCVAASNVAVRMTNESRKLSEELLKAFPSQEDINVFCKSVYITTFYCHQIYTNSGNRPEDEASDFVNGFARIPDPSTTPPILVARRMMIFALFLQYFRSQYTHGLTEHPSIIMDRLVETAVRLVTTNENVVSCIEGLELFILEGVFQNNGGNLRRAWLAFRKAMVIAQLMKIDHPNPPPVKVLDPNANLNPKFMWFRIVYMDSYLSLMLGLPHGGQETNMEHETPGETPSCRLERAHTLIARRIIDRNRHDSSFQDITATRELDRELLNVAKAVPDKFWLPPDFNTLHPHTREAFWETMRLCDQLHHYNLVHLLHLPYLLRCDKVSSYHTYAKITCVNASREIINRFMAFRNFNCNISTAYCRTADFLALMAGMTILLAHIDSHRLEVEDWRAHQRLGDRAIVAQLVEYLTKVAKHTNDSLTHKIAEELRRLLKIESETARGMGHSAHNTVCSLEEHCGDLQLSIPYFGIIKIGREGIKKDGPIETSPLQTLPTGIPDSVHVANHLFSTAGFGEALHQNSQATSFLSIPDVPPVQVPPLVVAGVNSEEELQQQQLQCPGLAASLNDWTFQGVDAAFFDSLMRGNVDWDQTLQ